MLDVTIRAAILRDSEKIATIIKTANEPVAKLYNITKTNAPKHPSNTTKYWVSGSINRGDTFFILEFEGLAIGVVSLAIPDNNIGHIRKLAVLPEFQKLGFGKMLVKEAESLASSLKIKSIQLGVIDQNQKVIEWYKSLGYRVKNIKKFSHLPFKICFMVKAV